MNPKIFAAGVAFVYICCFLFVVGATVVRADETIIDMSKFDVGDLVVDGFELKSKTRLSIHALGAETSYSDEMFAFGWILDAESREPVWVLSDEDTRRYRHSEFIREYEDEITLPAGRYEAFYYAGGPGLFNGSIKIDDLDKAFDLLGKIFDKKDIDDEYIFTDEMDDFDELMFTIKAPEGSFSKFNPVSVMKEKAIVDFSQPGNDFYEQKGFSLKKAQTLKIVAIGEYSSSDRVFVDHGWIFDARSRQKVWQMDKWNTSWAGGGRKNRIIVDKIELPEGDYVASYATDDSHSFGEWNVAPPYDPLHYGMVIYPVDKEAGKDIVDFVDSYEEPIIVQLNKVRNSQFKSIGFTLKTETNLHILALGEYGYQDEFVDYGWIEDLDKNEIVWEMTEDNTEHAGGASKNRKFDGLITLPKGNYMVYYVTDDSHAYRRWNSSAPLEKDMWGITVYGVGKDFKAGSIETFNEVPADSKLLVNLTKIGDDEEVQQKFVIDSDQKVHIFALGEGKDGAMFDFGWIENNDTDEIIWEMTYRKTRHAGGDRKNRQVDTHIFLEAGKYTAYFVTDGSHSFPNFNASRPDNPQKWGITVALE